MPFPASRSVLAVLIASLAVLALACTADDAERTGQRTAPLFVAIGASDSVGTGARNPSTEGWVPQLHAKMPAGTRMANLGIGGLQIRVALDQVLPVAVDLKPSVVGVWLAVNDYAADVPLAAYLQDLDRLLAGLRGQTAARVYVANMPDLTLLPAFNERPRDQLRDDVLRWNAGIAEAVEANGATLVDLYAGWAELRERPEYISRDGLHPSSRGHARLAEIFWRAMQGT